MLLLILDKLNDLVWTGIFLPCVLLCGLLLSLRSRFLQLRLFPASLRQLTKGGRGDGVSPVQAASTALASTLGTGNIVGTAQAIAMGGPGAVFWMWAAALLGMAVKFAEISLSVATRRRDGAGYSGGPMYYIGSLGEKFRPLALMYALLSATFIKTATDKRGTRVRPAAEAASFGSARSALLRREIARFLNCPPYMLNAGLGSIMALAAVHTLGIPVDLPVAIILSVMAALGACGASGVAGGSLLLIPMACSLFGINNDIAMQVVGVGFIIGVIQDSLETAVNSSSDALFTAAAEYKQWRKEGKEIKF